MRRTKRTLVILGLALAGCQGPVTFPATVTPNVVPVRILATTATYPLLQDLVAEYQAPDTLVNSSAASWEAIQSRLLAETGAYPSLYALTTFLPPDVAVGWWVAPVGHDAIAVIVHAGNPVPALTLARLRQLMAGEIASWAEVGGPDLPVAVVSHEPGADTYLAFDASVMRGWLPSGGAQVALSSARMVEIVARTPGAVGYISLGWLSDQAPQAGVRIVPLDMADDSPPVLPAPAAVSSGAYPLRTPVMLVGLAPPAPDSALYAWFAWMQSDSGQAIVGRHYAPAFP